MNDARVGDDPHQLAHRCDIVLDMLQHVVRDHPVICGIGPVDPGHVEAGVGAEDGQFHVAQAFGAEYAASRNVGFAISRLILPSAWM